LYGEGGNLFLSLSLSLSLPELACSPWFNRHVSLGVVAVCSVESVLILLKNLQTRPDIAVEVAVEVVMVETRS